VSDQNDYSSDEINANQLKALIERIERVEEEMSALKEDRKEIYAEAKGNGFDTKIVRKIIAIRKMDPDRRIEEETLIDLYSAAIGQD
jgi:uncharacterized protein (UPF0335 family)